MKKTQHLRICVLCLLMSLLLASCSGALPEASYIVNSDPADDPVLQTDTLSPVIALDDQTLADLTVRQVVNDYLTGSNRLTAFYTTNESSDGQDNWIYLRVPGCPASKINLNYLYPSYAWTPEAVAASYRDGTVAWWQSSYSNNAYLWSQDFEYEFKVCDGWLYINNYRSLPFACQTRASIDPMDLLRAYQSGEWNGDPIWSEDYSTSATIYSKHLYYYFENPVLKAGRDPRAIAVYQGCPDQPWWHAEDHSYNIQLISYHQFGDGRRASESIKIADLQLDLPNGTLEGSVTGELLAKNAIIDHRDDTSTVTTTDGTWLFSRGKVVSHWAASVDPTNSYLHDTYWDDNPALYLYTGSQFLRLENGGRYQVSVAQTAGFTTTYEGYSGAYFIENGSLKCLDVWNNEETVRTVIADHVVAATGFRTIFVAKDDGYSYILSEAGGQSAKLTQLGDGTIEYYDGLYRAWQGSTSDFVLCCQKQDLLSLEHGSLICA